MLGSSRPLRTVNSRSRTRAKQTRQILGVKLPEAEGQNQSARPEVCKCTFGCCHLSASDSYYSLYTAEHPHTRVIMKAARRIHINWYTWGVTVATVASYERKSRTGLYPRQHAAHLTRFGRPLMRRFGTCICLYVRIGQKAVGQLSSTNSCVIGALIEMVRQVYSAYANGYSTTMFVFDVGKIRRTARIANLTTYARTIS
jgi:hypothetical protein